MNRIGRLLSLAVLAICGLTLVGCDGDTKKTPVTIPAAPAALTATAASGAVELAWTASAGATEYRVYRATATGALATKTFLDTANGTIFTDTTVTNDTPYFYQVTATNSAGESGGSNEATATPTANLPPAAPTGLAATVQPTVVTLTWDDVPGASTYNVYWSTTSPVTTTSGAQIASVTSPYLHTGRTPGTTYYYVVTAVNAFGESAASVQVSATPALPAPYINATVVRWPIPVTGVPILEVEVFTAGDRVTPVTNATVTVNSTTLPYNATDERYAASSPMPAPGAAVTVSVTIPAGGAVQPGTYTASGTMYTSSPTVTSPTTSTTWTRSVANTMTWTEGAPTATSPASANVVGIQNPTGTFYPISMNGGPFEVAIGTTSYTLPANTLPAAGTYLAWVGIATKGIVDGTGAGVPFPGALAGSALRLGFVSAIIQFTAN